MSAGIDYSKGKAAAVFAFHPAWWGTGTTLDHVIDPVEAITLGGLDYEVQLIPDQHEINGKWYKSRTGSIVRMDTKRTLGSASLSYEVIQNTEAMSILTDVTREANLTFESAGAIRGGEVIWLLARKPGELTINTGKAKNGKKGVARDVVEPYILLSTGHDGKTALRILPTTVRVVCQNTLALALQGADGWLGVRHHGDVAKQVKAIKAALHRTDQAFVNFTDAAQAMANTDISKEIREEVIEKILTIHFGERVEAGGSGSILDKVIEKNVRQEKKEELRKDTFDLIMTNYENERQGVAGRDSAWALYNAIGEWTDHTPGFETFRGDDTAKGEKRMESILTGYAADVKTVAFEALAEASGVDLDKYYSA